MSKQTRTKFERVHDVVKDADGEPTLVLREKTLPPIGRELVKFKLGDIDMEAWMSPGQAINPLKEYERQFGRKYRGIHR